jgi:hypothetical protein
LNVHSIIYHEAGRLSSLSLALALPTAAAELEISLI